MDVPDDDDVAVAGQVVHLPLLSPPAAAPKTTVIPLSCRTAGSRAGRALAATWGAAPGVRALAVPYCRRSGSRTSTPRCTRPLCSGPWTPPCRHGTPPQTACTASAWPSTSSTTGFLQWTGED